MVVNYVHTKSYEGTHKHIQILPIFFGQTGWLVAERTNGHTNTQTFCKNPFFGLWEPQGS